MSAAHSTTSVPLPQGSDNAALSTCSVEAVIPLQQPPSLPVPASNALASSTADSRSLARPGTEEMDDIGQAASSSLCGMVCANSACSRILAGPVMDCYCERAAYCSKQCKTAGLPFHRTGCTYATGGKEPKTSYRLSHQPPVLRTAHQSTQKGPRVVTSMVTNLLAAAPHLAADAALSAALHAEQPLQLFDPSSASAGSGALLWGPAFESAGRRCTT